MEQPPKVPKIHLAVGGPVWGGDWKTYQMLNSFRPRTPTTPPLEESLSFPPRDFPPLSATHERLRKKLKNPK
jgi:hypothetical protein